MVHLGRPGEALDLLRLARSGSGDETLPRTRAMLHTIEAWAQASMGRGQAMRRVLGEAEELFVSDKGDGPLPVWMRTFKSEDLYGMQALAYRTLAEHEPSAARQAQHFAQKALELRVDGRERSRIFDHLSMASACFIADDPEQGTGTPGSRWPRWAATPPGAPGTGCGTPTGSPTGTPATPGSGNCGNGSSGRCRGTRRASRASRGPDRAPPRTPPPRYAVRPGTPSVAGARRSGRTLPTAGRPLRPPRRRPSARPVPPSASTARRTQSRALRAGELRRECEQPPGARRARVRPGSAPGRSARAEQQQVAGAQPDLGLLVGAVRRGRAQRGALRPVEGPPRPVAEQQRAGPPARAQRSVRVAGS